MIAANDQAQLYRLVGGSNKEPRVESLTRTQARARNGARSDGGKWIHDPAAESGEVTGAVLDITFAQQQANYRNGMMRDRLNNQAHTKTQKEAAMSAKSNKSARSQWNGLSMCQVIRVCGAAKVDKVTAKAILERAGFAPANGTLSIQLGKGKMKEDVPDLTDEVRTQLFGDLLPPAETHKPKRSKAERKARKAAKLAAKQEEVSTPAA